MFCGAVCGSVERVTVALSALHGVCNSASCRPAPALHQSGAAAPAPAVDGIGFGITDPPAWGGVGHGDGVGYPIQQDIPFKIFMRGGVPRGDGFGDCERVPIGGGGTHLDAAGARHWCGSAVVLRLWYRFFAPDGERVQLSARDYFAFPSVLYS